MARFGSLGTQYFDGNGDPLVAGKVYFFETGTTTPLTTYSDSGLTSANTHPVVLDADGRQPDIFFNGSAKSELRTSLDVLVESRDPVGADAGSSGPWDEWVSTVTYDVQDVVTGSNGEYYVSIAASNLGNNPTTDSANWTLFKLIRSWNTNETYALNQQVYGTDGFLYVSQQAANTANNPVGDFAGTWWEPAVVPVFTGFQLNDTTRDHQYVFAVSELAADRTVTMPLLLAGDTFVFENHIQALKDKTMTLPFRIGDTTNTHYYTMAVSELAADRTVTWPLLTGNDELVFKDHTATLSGKTLQDAAFLGSISEESYTLTGTAIDPANGTYQTKTLSGAWTATESLANGEFVTLRVINGDTHAVTWMTVTWVGGAGAPVLTADHIIEIWQDAGEVMARDLGTAV
jgi:hypothetical protein